MTTAKLRIVVLIAMMTTYSVLSSGRAFGPLALEADVPCADGEECDLIPSVLETEDLKSLQNQLRRNVGTLILEDGITPYYPQNKAQLNRNQIMQIENDFDSVGRVCVVTQEEGSGGSSETCTTFAKVGQCEIAASFHGIEGIESASFVRLSWGLSTNVSSKTNALGRNVRVSLEDFGKMVVRPSGPLRHPPDARFRGRKIVDSSQDCISVTLPASMCGTKGFGNLKPLKVLKAQDLSWDTMQKYGVSNCRQIGFPDKWETEGVFHQACRIEGKIPLTFFDGSDYDEGGVQSICSTLYGISGGPNVCEYNGSEVMVGMRSVYRGGDVWDSKSSSVKPNTGDRDIVSSVSDYSKSQLKGIMAVLTPASNCPLQTAEIIDLDSQEPGVGL